MAPDRYRDSNDPDHRHRDDPINKTAARQALATLARASVQYLLPPSVARDTQAVDLGDFLHRVQAALKDLVSAHSGRYEGLKEAVQQCFADVPAMRASMPKEVIGITVVRKIAGRSRGGIGTTFLPIAIRIEVETGRSEVCCAYENPRGLTISPWEPFSDALSTVSRISPVRLAEPKRRDIASTRFQRFVEHVISESVEAQAQPLVLIDSSNCVQLWGWLADQRLDSANIHLGDKQWMQHSWKDARLIRIRQNLAPEIVEAKEQHWAHSSLVDRRAQATLACDVRIQAPTHRFGLFRLTAAQAPGGATCYLSVGRKTLHMEKRGPSCYRETEAALPYSAPDNDTQGTGRPQNAAGLPLSRLAHRPAFIGQWPTPVPLEIVVTLRQAGDDPDRLAELVERLRYGFGHYGDWTSLPAPLFFERVVRDYISAFAFEESVDGEAEVEEIA